MKRHLITLSCGLILCFVVLGLLDEVATQAVDDASAFGPSECRGALFVIPSRGTLGWPYRDPAGEEPGYSTVHTGIDIHGSTSDDVYAADAGIVTYVDDRRIWIWHPGLGNIETFYAHL